MKDEGLAPYTVIEMQQSMWLNICSLLLIGMMCTAATNTACPFLTSPVQVETEPSGSVSNQPTSTPLQTCSQSTCPQINSGGAAESEQTGEAFDGYNLFDMKPLGQNGTAYITDLEGVVLKESPYRFPVEFFNSTTVIGEDNDYHTKLWNIYDDTVVSLDILGHHAREYNAIDNTILTMRTYILEIEEEDYIFDSIVEYNMDEQLVWSLDTHTFISHTQSCPFDDRYGVYLDLTHGNSLFFDSDDDVLYYNARNVNTFYKIDHKTGQVVWGLGEFGDFELFDINGVPCDSLFFHAHSVDQVDTNTFILFDNDYHNHINPDNRRSRILEITINETTMTANESWSWTPSNDYYSQIFGDADRLPNGNRLGVFGTPNHPDSTGAKLVEVTEAGEIVWERTFSAGISVYRMERFRFSPILTNLTDIHSVTGEEVLVEWQAWYNYRPKRTMSGPYTLYLDEAEIDSGVVSYDKFWRPTNLTFNLGTLSNGNYNLTLVVGDGDGHTTIDSVNVTVGEFFIERDGPTSHEVGQDESLLHWWGLTCSPLFYNITVNTTLDQSSTWNGEVITLDLASLAIGAHNITLRLFNGTELVHTDNFWATVYFPAAPVIYPSQSSLVSMTWNDTLILQWELVDDFPLSWAVLLENETVASDDWPTTVYLLNWTVPLLDEGLYNITVAAYDEAYHVSTNTTWLTVISPTPPVILPISGPTELEWGQENAFFEWEVHGGQQWFLWRNDTPIHTGALTGHEFIFIIENWQAEQWSLGTYNVTLQVIDALSAKTSSTLLVQISLTLGDPYANSVVTSLSDWYLYGDNAIGAPDASHAQVFLDYGNGYLSLDMGENEEIIDGTGNDFQVVAQGGEYTLKVSNSLASLFTTIGWGTGNLNFDLSGTGFSEVRYVRIEYRIGDTVELDAIVAMNYNEVEDDTQSPTITGPGDFWVWEDQTLISFAWETSDDTPWNYTIFVDEGQYELGPWDGSDIDFQYDVTASGTLNVTLVLFDVRGNKAHDTIYIDILPVDTVAPQITGPGDFWVWEDETPISFTWEASDDTPWNYTILVNSVVYESDLWNGSNIMFVYDVTASSTLNATLILFDLRGNTAQNTVNIEILPRTLGGITDPIIQLGVAILVLGTCLTLTVGLVWILRRRRVTK